jgi:thiol-disulfide isomerase/thioredoxin
MATNIENESDLNKSIRSNNTFLKIYAEWCGHCKALKPEWEKLVNEALSNDELKDNINLISIEETQLKRMSEKLQKKVEGFPTLLFIKKGEMDPDNYIQYSGDRNASSMLEFIKNQVKKESESNMTGGGRRRSVTRRKGITRRKGKSFKKTNRKKRSGHSKSKSRLTRRTKARRRTRN